MGFIIEAGVETRTGAGAVAVTTGRWATGADVTAAGTVTGDTLSIVTDGRRGAGTIGADVTAAGTATDDKIGRAHV